MTLPLPLEQAVPRRLSIRSELLGLLEITEDQLLTLPEGLLGFPQCRKWALLLGTKEGTAWLQSAEHPALVFLLVDPFVFFEGYAVDLAPSDLRVLQADNASEIAVFAIVTLPLPGQSECSTNLQGPVLINVKHGLGVQIVLDNSDFGIRAGLPIDRLT